MTLPASINEDLRWWNTVNLHKGNPIKNAVYELEIYSDASLTGWGAVCNGEKAHGHWTTLERELHINQLELIAAFFGLRAFAKDCKNCQILLHIDNTTAISYINRMGRVQFIHLNRVAREIWQWCERRNIWIHATYIASKDNVADIESRRLQDNTEFTLIKKAFSLVCNSFGYPEIDLFANRGNAKCKKYVSWHRDPDSIAIDAFTILWNKHFFYAFPPLSMIMKALQKIRAEKATGIMIVPEWPAQPWHPLFNKMLISKPVHLKAKQNLIFSSQYATFWERVTLVVGVLSGEHWN
uniref:RNase H type-1 domain-containing protein n=1 Tax=Trichogramma kaykai TaxID=54128 RepID=A0ABD2WRE4_9HYME